MHVLFVHQNFPAQFGHIAAYLTKHKGFKASFATQREPGTSHGVERIQYTLAGGATDKTSFFSRTFENAVWHSHGVYEAMAKRPDIKPDLVVAHSGFGSSIFLRELYKCPIINYFEYYYRARNSDIDFRPDFPSTKASMLRSYTRNAMILLDLDNCDVGYCPTNWQRERMPIQYQTKLETVFDGIDTDVWKPIENPSRKFGPYTFPNHLKIVTYVSRGMESMRGFDIFMKSANIVAKQRTDCLFVIVGEDRCCYGGDERITKMKSFKNWVLSQDQYDPSRFLFLGRLPPTDLARLFSVSDLHVYLTVPFVLSWSLMDSLACGATVLGSNTGPIREMITPGKNGLLADFFDIDEFAKIMNQVLDSPATYKDLGRAGTEMIRNNYSLDVCLPKMLALYERATNTFSVNQQARAISQ